MTSNVAFHRNGRVSVGGLVVGSYRQPDPSGARLSRSMVWILETFDGQVFQGKLRTDLGIYAKAAAVRFITGAALGGRS